MTVVSLSHRKDKATLLMTLIAVITTGNSVTRATDIVKRASACSDLKEHTLQNLDRQKVECVAGEAIISFHLTADGCDGNDMRYEYDCLSIDTFELESVVDRETSCTQMRGETLEYLNRQNSPGVRCSDGEFLLSFQLTGETCNGNDMNYAYSCAAMGPGTTQPPRERRTACTPFAGQRVRFLDRQAPTCDSGDVMVSFFVTSDNCQTGYMQYRFLCSKIRLSAPTPSPSSTSNPSLSSSSSPSPSSSLSPSPSPYCPDGQVEDDFARCCSSSFLGMDTYGKFKCCGLEVQEEDGGACPACDMWAPLGEKSNNRKFVKCTRCQNQLGVDCSQNDRASSRTERKCTTKKKKCFKWGYIQE